MNTNVKSWTCPNVAGWLREIGYEIYVEYFMENEIDGEALLSMSTEELFVMVKLFGDIFKLGPMLKFSKMLDDLKKETKRMKVFKGASVAQACTPPAHIPSDIQEVQIPIPPEDSPYRTASPTDSHQDNSVDNQDTDILPSSGEESRGSDDATFEHSATAAAVDQSTLASAPETTTQEKISVSLNQESTEQKSDQAPAMKPSAAVKPVESSKSATPPASGRSLTALGVSRTPLPSAHLAKSSVIYNYPSKQDLPDVTSMRRAYISYADSPMEFSMLFEREQDKAKKLGVILNRFYENDPYVLPLAPEMIKRGTACAVKFTDDNSWYRAKILDVHGDQVSVRYVDFGNAEKVPKGALMSLKRDKFCGEPALRIDCRLSGIPADIQISDEQKDQFYDMAQPMEKCFLVKFDEQVRKPPYSVHLTDVVCNTTLNNQVRRMLGLEPQDADRRDTQILQPKTAAATGRDDNSDCGIAYWGSSAGSSDGSDQE